MSLHAVPPVAMAAISAYVGILFAGLYFALAGLTDAQERRGYLTFALTCFAVIAYDAGVARLYSSRSFEEGLVWNRASLCTAGVLGSIYMTFVWDFLRRPLNAWLRGARVLMLAVCPLIGFWDSPYTQSSQRPDLKHVSVWGQSITYYEAANGLVTSVLYATFVVVYATATVYMIRHFRSEAGRHQRGRWGFFLGAVISGVAATNDILVGSGVYRSVYLTEYGFTCTILSMGYVLLMRFAELRGSVNTLNRSLSQTNAELVLALGRANESIRLKSEFLASISHELRTPLNAIINLPEAVLEQFGLGRTAVCGRCGAMFELEADEIVSADSACEMCGHHQLRLSDGPAFQGPPEQTQSRLRTVVTAGKHLQALVDDLLDASKLELGRTRLQPTTFACADLIEEIVATVRPMAQPRGISIERSADTADPFMLVADRVRIGQVLYNLLSNAIKFSAAGGRVEVSAAVAGAGELLLCVRDHGIGIDPAHHGHVFEKFRQVEAGATRTYGGTGLGLAISKDLVELHGGRIWIESRLGHGAAFFVQLPRSLDRVEQPSDDAPATQRRSA